MEKAPFVLVMAKCQSFLGKHFLILEPESANISWLHTILSEEAPLPMDPLAGHATEGDVSQFG